MTPVGTADDYRLAIGTMLVATFVLPSLLRCRRGKPRAGHRPDSFVILRDREK